MKQAPLPQANDDLVVLFDVDDTLFDNDRMQADLSAHIAQELGADARDRYWEILEQLRDELDYVDYLGALERYRLERLHDPRVLSLSNWLIDYPFADRLYPQALETVAHARRSARAVILSDGDAVFQPRKIARAGLWNAVDGQVLIYIHKEEMLADIERLFPARRYVLVEDKPRVAAAVKAGWGGRVVTVFVRQGHYANDTQGVARYPASDLAIERIGELRRYDLDALAAR
jgi:FMN phosphatase YigB (HAD superfamily)